MGSAGLDLHPHGFLQAQLLAPLALEGVVAAGVEVELAVVQMQDVADRLVEQFAVVADDQRGLRIFAQPRLEPERAFQVEIVGRFVEQQKIGLGEQGRGQRHAHPPAARELRHRPGQVGGGEAKPAQDLRRARGRPVGVDLGQAGIDLADMFGIGGLQRRQQPVALDVGGQHGVEQRDRAGRMLLVHRCDTGGLWIADLAAAGLQLALDQLEECGLAGAIAADQTDLGADGQGDGRGIEKPAPIGVEDQIIDAKHGEGSETGDVMT